MNFPSLFSEPRLYQKLDRIYIYIYTTDNISHELQHENHQLNINKTKLGYNRDYILLPLGIYYWNAKLINITKLTRVI